MISLFKRPLLCMSLVSVSLFSDSSTTVTPKGDTIIINEEDQNPSTVIEPVPVLWPWVGPGWYGGVWYENEVDYHRDYDHHGHWDHEHGGDHHGGGGDHHGGGGGHHGGGRGGR